MSAIQSNSGLLRQYSPAQLAAQAIGKQNLKPIQKGQVLNPGGWNQGAYHQARKLCADKSLHAAQKLIALMDSDDDRIGYMAALAVMERGIGKPRDHTDDEGIASRISLAALDKAERHALATLLQKALNGGSDAPSGPPPIIEGEAERQVTDNAKENGE